MMELGFMLQIIIFLHDSYEVKVFIYFLSSVPYYSLKPIFKQVNVGLDYFTFIFHFGLSFACSLQLLRDPIHSFFKSPRHLKLLLKVIFEHLFNDWSLINVSLVLLFN